MFYRFKSKVTELQQFMFKTSTRQKLTAVAQVAHMMLGLVVDPHMIRDISRREQFATNMAGNFVLMSDHMSTQPVLCGKRRLARLQKVMRRVLIHANSHHSESSLSGFFLMLKHFVYTKFHYMLRIWLQKVNREAEQKHSLKVWPEVKPSTWLMHCLVMCSGHSVNNAVLKMLQTGIAQG